jgi:putative FmdB family regulatory protein
MPIYEYQCTQCGERFEVRQSIGEDGSKLHCPKCNAQNPERLVSSFFSPGSSTSAPSGISCPTCNTGTCRLPPM